MHCSSWYSKGKTSLRFFKVPWQEKRRTTVQSETYTRTITMRGISVLHCALNYASWYSSLFVYILIDPFYPEIHSAVVSVHSTYIPWLVFTLCCWVASAARIFGRILKKKKYGIFSVQRLRWHNMYQIYRSIVVK